MKNLEQGDILRAPDGTIYEVTSVKYDISPVSSYSKSGGNPPTMLSMVDLQWGNSLRGWVKMEPGEKIS